mgnify:CR=1 FL=1
MEKKYLSDCIRYTTDIAPYPFIQIYSGVGSGKNTFVDALAKGYEESQPDGRMETLEPKRVLCITSRRAKVDELKNAEDVAYGTQVLEYESLDYVEDLDSYFASKRELSCNGIWGTIPIYQRSIACTNAAIERYLEKHYRADKAEDFLWNRFDIIVVDEAHAVVADASYQTAPYYVHSLINQTLKMNAAGKTNCKVIVMTGSPQILEDFRLPKNGHAIDLMDRCVRVEPKHVLLADKAEVTEDMKQRLAAGEKVIYFANRVSTVLNLYRNALQEYRNEAAVSFSSDDELDKQEKETREILEKRDEIQAYIAENQKLPDDIRLFLTTSKNKEGINIKNADIKTMYIETHSQIDAIQMAGRVRAGLDQLYIVTDAVQNSAPESPFEYELSGRADLKASLNALLAQKKEDAGIAEGAPWSVQEHEEIRSYIAYIQKKFPHFCYDYFADTFCLYSDRHSSRRYYAEQNAAFVRAVVPSSGYCLCQQEAAKNRRVFPCAGRSERAARKERCAGNQGISRNRHWSALPQLQSFHAALWLCDQKSLWQHNEPKLRQTDHHKDRDRQNVKGGESFSRFLLYRKNLPPTAANTSCRRQTCSAVRAAPVLLA